jgi:hypothetical protein
VPRAATYAAARLDPSPDPEAPTGESLEGEIRRGEATLVSLPDRNRKILGPSNPDLHRKTRRVHVGELDAS